jgi:hypothetical protein
MKDDNRAQNGGETGLEKQTNLYRIREKNKKHIGKHSKRALLIYACYIVLKEDR